MLTYHLPTSVFGQTDVNEHYEVILTLVFIKTDVNLLC